MTLAPGTFLGPYEILAPLGAGGMGEVWKGKDSRLDRFIAIKVLPEHLAKSPEALARFEREAKAVAALNHPNITGIFDIGRVDDTAYAVMELLEGESLRSRLAEGPLPPRRATELAIQMAQGLAAAHEKGVIHRDLKPDNLWITTEGRLKILDFGLAKHSAAFISGSGSLLPTEVFSAAGGMHTEKGTILGTIGYMSPEQVRGEPVDARSDLFSFGAVLFEMLTGRRAFARDTAADTLAAILKEDPPEPDGHSHPLPPALARILDHCLEKVPARRFRDAQDLAFALESATQSSSGSGASLAPRADLRTAPWKAILVCAGIAAIGLLGGWLLRSPQPDPTFKQLTFRRGNILAARFTPDGQSAVYAASWDGRPTELFLARLDGTSARPLGIAKATVQAINRQGELLVILKGEQWGGSASGVLAQIPLEGGLPRELLERVRGADFGPDGKEVAVVHQPTPGGPQRLDFPLGQRLLEFEDSVMGSPRVSRDGKLVALCYWDDETDTQTLAVVDRKGSRQVILRVPTFEFQTGPVWSPDGRELYFTADNTLRAVSLGGKVRTLRWDSAVKGLNDVSTQGGILMERFISQSSTVARRDGKDMDLSYSEKMEVQGLSADGSQAFLNAFGGVAGSQGQVGVRQTDGSPPKILGPGYGLDLSPDGKWVLIVPLLQSNVINLIPTGPGVTRELRQPGWTLSGGRFTADGRYALVEGRQGKGARQFLRFPVEGGPAEVLRMQFPIHSIFSSEDGRALLTLDGKGRPLLRPLDGGADQLLAPTLAAGERILGWDLRDRILVGQLGRPASVSLDLVDLKTGQRRPWQVVGPADPSGVMNISGLVASRDFRTLVYSYRRVITSDLFLVDGLR